MNVCREHSPMLCLEVLLRVAVQVEMDDRPLLKSDQQDRAKNGCKLLTHLYLSILNVLAAGLGSALFSKLAQYPDCQRPDPLSGHEAPFSRSARDHRSYQILARISHHLTVEARDRPAITSLRLLAVLTVLSEYASARQAARASY